MRSLPGSFIRSCQEIGDVGCLRQEEAVPRRAKVIAVMPAYNAASTLEATVRDIPKGSVDEIILEPDGLMGESVMNALARRLERRSRSRTG